MDVIVFEINNVVHLCVPSPDAIESVGIGEVASRVVPENIKFYIVSATSLPHNYPQESWRIVNGVVTVDSSSYNQHTINLVTSARKGAYSNPQTGSDRLFAEAQRMQMMGETGWEAVRGAAIARYNEIKSEYPWPKEE